MPWLPLCMAASRHLDFTMRLPRVFSRLAVATAFSLSISVATAQTPGDAMAARAAAIKDWAYTLAVQAATWGAPLVTMYDLRFNDAVGPTAKAKPNALWRMEDISTPELSVAAGYVTPNVNVVYGFGFLDLRREPIILDAPDSNGRYYMVEIVDMWTNAFAYIGGRATGYKGGKFALVGPGWSGTLPPDVRRIDCPTPWVLIQPRVHIYHDGALDLGGARKVLSAIRPISLAVYDNKPVSASARLYLSSSRSDGRETARQRSEFQRPPSILGIGWRPAMAENPPPDDQIRALLPMFRPLGLEVGKAWDRTKVRPPVLAAMEEAARNVPSMLARIPVGRIEHFAALPPPTIGNFGTDYATRAVIARIGLTANTPTEAVYWNYGLDQKGAPLTGQNKYTLTLPSDIPYEKPGFWSVTMYDVTNNYTVPNPIDRYMLGSDSSGLKRNVDGSITIYVQNESPGPEKAANWLPSPPGGFYMTPRSYVPTAAAVQMLTDPAAWPVPPVVRVP